MPLEKLSTVVVPDPEPGPSAPVEAPFYIPATGGPSRPRRTLKHNDTFAVLDSHGDIGAVGGASDGLFHTDTRHLSLLELLINGTQPLLLGSSVRDDNLNFNVDLTNSDIYADGKIALLKDTVHIARTLYLYEGSLRQRIALVNHGAETVRLSLALAFASDFADIFEVRGVTRLKRGVARTKVLPPDRVALSYRGLDDVVRETTLSFEPAPDAISDSSARYDITLEPQGRMTLFVVASNRGQLPTTQSFFRGLAAMRRVEKRLTRHVASVETSNTVLNEVLCRSMADLYMLVTQTPEGPFPYAGIPWYSTTFGRDGIITALEMLWADPALALGVLRRLARLQAKTENPDADAQPGKILHETRGGEMAGLGEVPFSLYYGSIDATPLYVMLAGAYLHRTADVAAIRELWPAIERALAWIDACIEEDPRGFLCYQRARQTGLANQGWKDSHDSVFHADGRYAKGPIALVEVQGYVFAAKEAAAKCAAALCLTDIAARLQGEAIAFRDRFEQAFWCEDIGTYAIALDGTGARCAVRTSNPGHALATGIAAPARAARVAASLLGKEFMSGWGIRTVGTEESRYNPMSYHNGSVWPHDNAIVAAGLARYGYRQGAGAVFEAIVRATTYMDHRRIPELYCGFRRKAGRGPTLYPAACAPQAWSAAAPFYLLQSLLGLEFDCVRREIRLTRPHIPEFAGDITVRNLRLGDAVADFTLRQRGGAISLQVLRVSGDLGVSLVFDALEVHQETGQELGRRGAHGRR